MTVIKKGREITEPLGGVFADSPKVKATRAEGAGPFLYLVGPASAKSKEPMFTCPVSAIPEWVFTMLALWWQCRAMKALPMAGGVLDQPMAVRLTFPVFEGEWRKVETEDQASWSMAQTMAAVRAMLGR